MLSDVSVTSYLAVLEFNGGECDASFKNVACPKGNGRFFKVFTEYYDPGTLLALCFIEPVCVGLVLGNDGTGDLRRRTHQKAWYGSVAPPMRCVGFVGYVEKLHFTTVWAGHLSGECKRSLFKTGTIAG